LLDWLENWIAHDDTHFYIAYLNDGPISLNWAYNLYIDTDGISSTGYNGYFLQIGADYLIQGIYLYQYTGNGSSWSWRYVGELAVALNSNQAELSLPRVWLGDPSEMQIVFLGENAAYSGGSMEDYYPDGAPDPSADNQFFSYLVE
jgi:hypothetical protein